MLVRCPPVCSLGGRGLFPVMLFSSGFIQPHFKTYQAIVLSTPSFCSHAQALLSAQDVPSGLLVLARVCLFVTLPV